MADTVDKTEELYPIAVLIDELKVCNGRDGVAEPEIKSTADISSSMTMFSLD